MGASHLTVSLACTALSFVALYWWSALFLNKLRLNGWIDDDTVNLENSRQLLHLLSKSYVTLGLVVNFVINMFIMLNLGLKSIFFSELHPSEIRKMLERLLNYIIYKGTLLPAVIPPTLFHGGLWSIWLIVLCMLKMFQALARDRLERLNASPSALMWAYSRAYSALWFVLVADLLWLRFCWTMYSSHNSSMLLLLFFEPLSIAFETMQAMLIYGFQLLDVCLHHFVDDARNCKNFVILEKLSHGSLSEWKGVLIRNLGFALDMSTLLTTLGHWMQIWWLRGMMFHLADAILFFNIRGLLSAIAKRVKGFVKLTVALGSLHAALPDATSEELKAYDDECAICREPMAKAKRLHCNHLFHLACLRSWLDQGLNEIYSCPTCRKPLLVSTSQTELSDQTADISSDELLARQLNEGVDGQNAGRQNFPAGLFRSQSLGGNPLRSARLESSWIPRWHPSSNSDGAGTSSTQGSVGLGSVHMMMRHFASVGDSYPQTALQDSQWSLWSANANRPSTSDSLIPAVNGSFNSGLRVRTTTRTINEDIARILPMVETVREILPHIPNDLILQDLQRTNSVAVTVNNFLLM